MGASISFISLNIERSKHLDRVIPFIAAGEPEVLCLQELAERDIAAFESALGMKCIYAPSGVHPSDDESPDPLIGIGIFTSLPVRSHSAEYYSGSAEAARMAPAHAIFVDNPLLCVEVEKEGTAFCIMTTHFTWTPDGGASDAQRRNIELLLSMLAQHGEFVLSGDFNAPRMHKGAPGEIFSKLSGAYTDNIPSRYETSIDASLHRNGATAARELSDKMVDGLFTSPTYRASGVELHPGVSDHCAITATISRSD